MSQSGRQLTPQSIATALLSGLNDGVAITPYAHGFLASLPIYYYDNDRVKLFIETFESGVKVSDRGMTAMRLAMAEVNLQNKRVEDALRQSIGNDLFSVAAEEGEISGFGKMDDLAPLVFSVAAASLRVDQLRWLAVERRPIAFRERVVDELVQVVGENEQVTPHAPIALKSGRSKQVTASVAPRDIELRARSIYVQALSGQDPDARESAVARCFHLFSLANVPRDRLVAVASGTRDDWPAALVTEISQVSSVAFFDERGSIARTVESKLAVVGG